MKENEKNKIKQIINNLNAELENVPEAYTNETFVMSLSNEIIFSIEELSELTGLKNPIKYKK